MRVKTVVSLAVLAAGVGDSTASAQSSKYPPLQQYMMSRDAETALARSAAPANISGRATIKVLSTTGYQVVREGDSGFVCLVLRGWAAPTYTPTPVRDLVYDAALRAPICFDREAARTVLPYYELRSKLGMEGKNPDQIADAVQARLREGRLAQAGRGRVRVHVVCRSGSRTGGSFSSSHDGLLAVLQEFHARRSRVRRAASASERRRRNPICRGRNPSGRHTCH